MGLKSIMKKRTDFAVSTFLILVMVLSALSPAGAATKPEHKNQPSWHRIAVKFNRTIKRLGLIAIGAKPIKVDSKTAVAATTKNLPPAPAKTVAAAPLPGLPASAARVPVTASGPFFAQIGDLRKTFSGNQKPAVGYATGKYFLVEGDRTLAVSPRPIKFMPGAGNSVLSLPEYQDLNWNGTTNLNSFRGNIEIVFSAKSKQLWAVNELGMEDYLRGMAEASHDSPEEHLKVMAILARSYAVHHLANGGRHPGEPFHLKNSRNGNGDDQVYRGYGAETRQPRIAKATADTAGLVVTYQGRPVITPYSTRADGRTRSPAEAGWKVNWPWVKSVPDPDTAGMSRLGHGVGVSGHGSRKKAERGETAAQILGYYFPGTALGRIDTVSKVVRIGIYAR